MRCVKMQSEIKKLMINAIKEERPDAIKKVCREVWNQPFFFKIDKAKCLTLSYAPTDKGAATNYFNIYEKYKQNNDFLTAEQIYDLLYNFKKEVYWRSKFDRIFSQLGIDEKEIAHLDMSSFPYDKDIYRVQYSYLDKTYKYPIAVIDLLNDQLEYILIDGKDNKEVINKFFVDDYTLYRSTKLEVNRSGRMSELSIYKHRERKTVLIYFGTFLYGATCVSLKCVDEIAAFIRSNSN